MICQAVAWTLAPALTHRTVPMDVAEGYAWGREWVLATYKHPALPSWLLEFTRVATGVAGWPAYVVSQLFVVATYFFVFLLGRDLVGSRAAAAGTLLLAGVAFYAWPTVEFNHNVAQMPVWALLPLTLWRAVERRSGLWWLAFAVVAAIGVYAKISTLMLTAVLLLWVLWDGKARGELRTPWPWLGAILFIALATPLAVWLVRSNFAPMVYAASRSKGVSTNLAQFIGEMALNAAGLVALLALAGLLSRRKGPDVQTQDIPNRDARVVPFLFAITLGPLLLAILGALVSGGGLKSSWGSSMFNYVGILALALTHRRLTDDGLLRLSIAAVCIALIAPLCYAAIVLAGPYPKDTPMRANWPQAEIAARMSDIWRRETGGAPLRIVGGSGWVSDLIALTDPDKPSVYSGPQPAGAPWVTPERIEREGLLIVWHTTRFADPAIVEPYLRGARLRQERFSARRWLEGPDIVINYLVVPPRARQ